MIDSGNTADSPALEPGLYIVGTPIGNLEDITLRALRVLKTCDSIAAEDTRRTRKLLHHFEINVRVISFREHNRARMIPEILKELRQNRTIALVSDAGMPCISDPGAELIAACYEAGLDVFIVPGPSAITTAVAKSGLPGDTFLFLGFPPAKQNQRKEYFGKYSNVDAPLLFYEAPHRILRSLNDILEILGDRDIRVMRELTKIHEEMISGSVSSVIGELSLRDKIKGEFTVLVAQTTSTDEKVFSDQDLSTAYENFLEEGMKPNDALKKLTQITGKSKRDLYNLLRVKG